VVGRARLADVSIQRPGPPLIQDGRYGSSLGFRFYRFSDKHLGRLVLILICGLLGVTAWRKVPFNDWCRCLFKIAAILNLVSGDYLTNAWINWSIFSSPSVSYIAMTWRPMSSVSKARFITAGAISMKLGVRIPLGNTPSDFLIFAI
jgi:hypothetical protein